MAPQNVADALDKIPHPVVYTILGVGIAWAARVISFFLRKDRVSVEDKLKKLFDWNERSERELKDFKTHVAEHYASKEDLREAMKANREDHTELKGLVLEVRSMLVKRAVHGGEGP